MNYLSKIYIKIERFKRIRLQKLGLRQDVELITQIQPKKLVQTNFNLLDDPLKKKQSVDVHEVRDCLTTSVKQARIKTTAEVVYECVDKIDQMEVTTKELYFLDKDLEKKTSDVK